MSPVAAQRGIQRAAATDGSTHRAAHHRLQRADSQQRAAHFFGTFG